MPRPSLIKVPLAQYKGGSGFLTHKIRRDDFVDKYALRYPIYMRIPKVWRDQFEARPPILNEINIKGTKRPQESGLWTTDSEGLPKKVENIPIKVTRTKTVKEGLWGGEGIIHGFKHARGIKTKTYSTKQWLPIHFKKTCYSEVLEREIETTVTPRTLDLIDEAFGFDHYILKTPLNELCSSLGGNLKREMLLRLLNKDTEMYKLDHEAREKIYQRYKKYIIPKDQAEWVGLSLQQAMDKMWKLEKDSGLHDSVPLLQIYAEELKQKLREEMNRHEKTEQKSESDDTIAIFSPPSKVKM